MSVFLKVSVYISITFGQTLKSSHELSSLLYLCYKRHVILSASEENSLICETFFGVKYIFPITETSTVVRNVYFCALYMLRNFILKNMKFNVHNETSP